MIGDEWMVTDSCLSPHLYVTVTLYSETVYLQCLSWFVLPQSIPCDLHFADFYDVVIHVCVWFGTAGACSSGVCFPMSSEFLSDDIICDTGQLYSYSCKRTFVFASRGAVGSEGLLYER